MYISLDNSHIDNEIAEKYFRALDGSEEKINLRKAIRASAIMSCNDNPDIPDKYKRKVGDRMSREYVSAMDAAAIDFQYFSGEFGMPGTVEAEKEREKRHKEIAIVRKTHYIDKTTKQIRKRGFRVVEKSGIETIISVVTDDVPTVKWTTRVIMFVSRLIPDDVKIKIKEKAENAWEKASNTINRHIERFEQTPLGSKLKNVMENKVTPVIEKGYNRVADVCSSIKNKAKSLWTKAKSFFA